MQNAGPEQLIKQVIEKELCTGCGACAALCPYFEVYKGKSSSVFPCDRSEGQCYAYCPQTETDREKLSGEIRGSGISGSPLGHYRKIALARSKDQNNRVNYQNGGTVSVLTTHALKTGIINAAILTRSEKKASVCDIVTDAEKVTDYSSSKYTSAPVVKKAIEASAAGHEKIGIVGTPCHMTSLAKIRTNPLEKPEIPIKPALAIGLFCTWALDTRAFERFLAQHRDTGKIKGMDVPPPPAEEFLIKTDKKTLTFPLDEIRAMIPGSCGVCMDMTAEWADISVGAFEDDRSFNTVIIRSEAGEKLFQSAVDAGVLITQEIPEHLVPSLEKAATGKRTRAEAILSESMENAGSQGEKSIENQIVGFR